MRLKRRMESMMRIASGDVELRKAVLKSMEESGLGSEDDYGNPNVKDYHKFFDCLSANGFSLDEEQRQNVIDKQSSFFGNPLKSLFFHIEDTLDGVLNVERFVPTKRT